LAPFFGLTSACELKGTVRDDPEILGQGAGGGLRKEDTELKARINAAIKAVRESGEYAAITAKYFNFDIYGG
jgi:polar amino acid transport system substrate-binding protein